MEQDEGIWDGLAGTVIERAAPDDWIAIAHLNVWAYREFAVELGPEVWPEVVRKLTDVGQVAKQGAFFVVRSGIDPIASVAYRHPGHAPYPLPADWASIDLLAVAPPERNRGLGTALIQACEIQAIERGVRYIGAIVAGYQTDAQELFTGMGFHREQGLRKAGQSPYWIFRKRPLSAGG